MKENGDKKEAGLMKAAPELLKSIIKILPFEILIALAVLTVCVKTGSYFLTAGSIYMFINVFVRTTIFIKAAAKKKKEVVFVSEKKMYINCLCGSTVLSVASLFFLGCGISMFFLENQVINRLLAIIIMFLTGINLFITLCNYLMVRGYNDVLIKSYRIMNYADTLISLTIIVGAALMISDSTKIEQLVGLTGVVLGGGILGLTGYILWYVSMTNEKIRNMYCHIRNNSTIIFTKLSIQKDIVVVLGKIILSFITLSGFVLANALYSAGMGIAKICAIKTQENDVNKQIHSYFQIGAAIFGSSLCYVIYSLSMFTEGKSIHYNMNIALIIAAYTFTELFLIIRDYIRARKSRNLISEGIKLIGLSSILICVVLTQTAIMSISYEGDARFYNGLSGVLFGSVAAFVGIYMMIRSKSVNKNI